MRCHVGTPLCSVRLARPNPPHPPVFPRVSPCALLSSVFDFIFFFTSFNSFKCLRQQATCTYTNGGDKRQPDVERFRRVFLK